MRVSSSRRGRDAATEVRGPVEQMLAVILPGFERTGWPRRELPFSRAVLGFFDYLTGERGLRPESIMSYRHHLACFEAFLDRIGATRLQDLSSAILSAFVAEDRRGRDGQDDGAEWFAGCCACSCGTRIARDCWPPT